MIAYFDTSALVPLVVDERATAQCREHWLAADRLVSVVLTELEARAALAQASRAGRLTPADLRVAALAIDGLLAQVDVVAVDADLVRLAGDLAERHALRGYDAVHLAAASALADDDVVVVAGDRALVAAAAASGLATAAVG